MCDRVTNEDTTAPKVHMVDAWSRVYTWCDKHTESLTGDTFTPSIAEVTCPGCLDAIAAHIAKGRKR